MPAKSKSQQRLFQMALAVRHGELDRSKVYKSVLDIVDSDMTDEQIKHFTILEECDSNFSTPMNTIGMGNVNIDGGPDLITKRTKNIKRKRRMKNIKEYIHESFDYVNSTDLINKFYRANIAKENEKEKIGDVVEISRKHYSTYDKAFVFGKPDKYSDWTYAMSIKLDDIKSNSAFQKYISKLNKEDEFFQYFINKEDAEKCANKAKADYKKQKYTLESLLSDIESYKPLTDLGYDYKITDVYQNKSKSTTKEKCIYVNHAWKINVDNNKIIMHNAGWRKYFVANVQSIYKVLSSKNETQRISYSYDYENE